jgi:alkyl sulfatase BDS1-like metallo-beta-lactamase superfamily hydrolase
MKLINIMNTMEIDRKASDYTIAYNKESVEKLDFTDTADFDDSRRGYVENLDYPKIIYKEGSTTDIAYDMTAWNFIDGDSPDTVNPSLWRQSALNKTYGLFEVVKGGIYQIRGFDMANMTFVKGNKVWIVIEVLGTKEAASAGIQVLRKYLENKAESIEIAAIIITHPHADHYGGMDAFSTCNVPVVIGPKGFMEHGVNENLMAGRAMYRRARYMYGMLIDKSPEGTVGSGLGQTNSSGIQILKDVTVEIDENSKGWDEKGEINWSEKIGIEIEFIYVAETEAPCEIMMYFPEYCAFCVAEEINRNMHNLITLRGAKVRNGLVWSKAIDTAIVKYGDVTEVSFSTHHWPTWTKDERGKEDKNKIKDYWVKQRDMYRWLHDRTLYSLNRGLTPAEIAETLQLPDSLASEFYNRGYYGTLSHNVKSQYQMYLGWFDGNPANLNPLPPAAAGKKYVELIGEDEMLRQAKGAFEKGEYRWVAMLLNHLVFANPENRDACILLANTYIQLGYQAESGPWRNFYLTAAKELIDNPIVQMRDISDADIENLDARQLFDFMAINLKQDNELAKKEQNFSLYFTDIESGWLLVLSNEALTNRETENQEEAHFFKDTMSVFKTALVDYHNGNTRGEPTDSLFELFDFKININFNIVTP